MSNKHVCINCASDVSLNNSHGLSSDLKIRASKRKIRRRPGPDAANWKHIQLTVCQALDVIFQLSTRYDGLADADLPKHRLCGNCMKMFSLLFHQYLEFITASHVDSLIYNLIQSNDAIQRYLPGYLSTTSANDFEVEEHAEEKSESMPSVHNEFTESGTSEHKNQLLTTTLPSFMLGKPPEEVQNASSEREVELKVEAELFLIPEIDCDEEHQYQDHSEFSEYQDDKFEIDSVFNQKGIEPKLKRKNKSRDQILPLILGTSRKKSSRVRKAVKKLTMTSNSLKLHKCNKCNEIFQTRDILLRHAAVHRTPAEGGAAKRWCSICNCGFTTLKRQRDHMFKLHPQAQIPGKATTYSDFHCPKCPLKFLTAPSLRRHLVSKHFHCPVCEATFLTTEGINTHMDSNHEPDWLKPPIFCELCGYKTYRDIFLRRHRLDVHALGEGKFTCDLCGKKLMNNESFIKHKARHSDERPFKCDKCEMSYKFKSNLNVHRRAVHAGIKFICEICGHVTSNSYNLKKHVDGIHRGITQSQKRATTDGERKKRFRLPMIKEANRKSKGQT